MDLREIGCDVWIGYNSFRIGINADCYEHANELWFHKSREFQSVAQHPGVLSCKIMRSNPYHFLYTLLFHTFFSYLSDMFQPVLVIIRLFGVFRELLHYTCIGVYRCCQDKS
jgi:hypothetical protein